MPLARDGRVSEEAASIRGIIDACDLGVYIFLLCVQLNVVLSQKLNDDETEQMTVRELAESYFFEG